MRFNRPSEPMLVMLEMLVFVWQFVYRSNWSGRGLRRSSSCLN